LFKLLTAEGRSEGTGSEKGATTALYFTLDIEKY
jgi:hypothetical protein